MELGRGRMEARFEGWADWRRGSEGLADISRVCRMRGEALARELIVW